LDRRRVKLALATLFFAATGYAAFAAEDTKPKDPNPPATIKIDVARGDRWNYDVRDDLTDELRRVVEVAVTDVTDSEIDVRLRATNVTTNAEATSVALFDRDWRQKETGQLMFHPADDQTGVPTDIQVGKTWPFKFQMTRANPPARGNFIGTAKVESWERVDLGNGLAYDAFKIAYDSSVTPVVNNRKVEWHVELWFAPAAQRYVKRRLESRQNGKLVESTLETLRDYQRREQ